MARQNPADGININRSAMLVPIGKNKLETMLKQKVNFNELVTNASLGCVDKSGGNSAESRCASGK